MCPSDPGINQIAAGAGGVFVSLKRMETQLARLEGKFALEALFKRWPKLALAIPSEQIRWRPRPGLRAVETLLVVAA